MVADRDGNLYVTGYSSGSWWDIATVKYHPAGNQVWVVRYNGAAGGDDVPRALAVDDHGNVYVAGYTDITGTYNYDYVTVKYDSLGVQKWAATYHGAGNGGLDEAFGVAVDREGNVYVTGDSFEPATDHDFATIKYSPEGAQLWVRRYDGPAHAGDAGNGIVLDADGNVYVTGLSNQSASTINYDAATLKYDTLGTLRWARRYNGAMNGSDSGIGIKLDSARNVVVCGYTAGAAGRTDALTIQYSNAGEEQWVRTYDDSIHGFDTAVTLAIGPADRIVVTGNGGPVTPASDYLTIEYDAAGNPQWVRFYDGPVSGYDEGQALVLDPTGNVYVTGYSDGGTGVVNYDYATVKYDSSGNEEWAVRYNGPGDNIDVAAGIACGPDGSVYVSGWSAGTRGTLVDYATIEYDQGTATAVAEAGGRIPLGPGGLCLAPVGPNPFLDGTMLEFSLPARLPVEIGLWDVAGRRVATLAEGGFGPGPHRVAVSGLDLAPGLYLARIRAGSLEASVKIIRIR